MSFFRSYVAPFLIVLIFAIAMLAVSARIFLPGDMLAPAPISFQEPTLDHADPSSQASAFLPSVDDLLHGPQDLAG